MNDVFKEKYLKYEPKITLEIFTLVWNRLIELGYKSFCDSTVKERYDEFKERYGYFMTIENHPNLFNCYNSNLFNYYNSTDTYTKTTVEEILGYNPFIKETKFEAKEFAKTLVESVKHYNDTINTIELKEFPKEGCCKTNQIELRDYLKNKFSQDIQKSWRSYYNIVAWNEIGYWFCEEKSSKPEYQLSQLQKFFTKEEVKQPLKQAVHCKTQEEWDFVSEKLGNDGENWFIDPKWGNNKSFCISFEYKNQSQTLDFYQNAGYQILSFQEWCDLNGYKMEKEVKFEVGKWYSIKTAYNWIIKFKEIKDGNIRADWHCLNERGKKVEEGGYWQSEPTEIKELSIEEIQLYLPEGHPNKIKSNQEFKVGDYVILENAGGWNYSSCNDGCLGLITKMSNYKPSTVDKYICSITGDILNSKNKDTKFNDVPVAFYEGKWIVRHATPEEINNHLISIGEIPAGESLNNGIEPNKDGAFKYTTLPGSSWSGCTIQNHLEAIIPTTGNCYDEDFATSYIQIKPKMILSIDDEELPMVNIIKTNTIKQLLNND